tara:strand:- start:742 stop:1629 length:888 start_codon:yes stop_codon:yes gene_type:complete
MKLRNLVNLKALKEEDFTHTPGLHQKDYSEQTPLEVQAHDDNQLYYIDTEYIEAYIHGDTVTGIDPDRGHEDKELNRDNSDATPGQIDDEDPRMDPAIRSDFDDPVMGDEDIDEGTCGYGKNGKLGKKPAGPHLGFTKRELSEHTRLQQLAGIKPLYESTRFDDRFKDQMGKAGFSDEEMDDVMSKSDQSWGFKEPGEDEGGSPFPGEDTLPDFDENDVRNIEDEAKQTDEGRKTEYVVEILLPVTVPHFLLGLGAQDETGREEIAKKIADFYRKKSEIHPKAYIGAVEKRNPAR